ncbi:MAG: hypothetical protein QOJ72_2534 [Nocardioidaceae bacterium]|jgi:hypothetical protein|nr:hypothetical protein [Nocardioidaceae bacterium]
MSAYVGITRAKPRFPAALLAVLISGVVVLAICLTWTYLSMRAVMDVGGSCADGGPYVSAQPCPAGAGFVGIAIPLGVVAGLAASVAAVNLAAPSLVLGAWAALFGTLGWNFFDYAFSYPGGTDPGFLVCGIVFWLMALPALLIMLIPRFAKLGAKMGGGESHSTALWWGIYAGLGVIGTALGVWSFYAWR